MSRVTINKLGFNLTITFLAGLLAIDWGTAGAEEGPTTAAHPRPHPLDPALEMAEEGLRSIRENVRDYTATVVKRERIGGKVGDPMHMQVKIRHEQIDEGRVVVPFSVYIRFLSPRSWEGREAIFVKGRNQDRIIAHKGGIGNFLWFRVPPDGQLAMWGNRYPITDIGVLNLVEKLVERAERELELDDCEVVYSDNAKVEGRSCNMIQLTHPNRKPEHDFYRARIFVDEKLQLPIRYVAWDWPARDGEQPQLLEEYTYLDVRVNVGLTDRDFDPNNPAYDYP
jgi:hypothetical protein